MRGLAFYMEVRSTYTRSCNFISCNTNRMIFLPLTFFLHDRSTPLDRPSFLLVVLFVPDRVDHSNSYLDSVVKLDGMTGAIDDRHVNVHALRIPESNYHSRYRSILSSLGSSSRYALSFGLGSEEKEIGES